MLKFKLYLVSSSVEVAACTALCMCSRGLLRHLQVHNPPLICVVDYVASAVKAPVCTVGSAHNVQHPTFAFAYWPDIEEVECFYGAVRSNA